MAAINLTGRESAHLDEMWRTFVTFLAILGPGLIVMVGDNDAAVADLGYGVYAMRGSWTAGPLTNIDYQQSVAFAGAQYAETPRSAVLVSLRHANFTGMPSERRGPSPAFDGWLVVFEQRYKI